MKFHPSVRIRYESQERNLTETIIVGLVQLKGKFFEAVEIPQPCKVVLNYMLPDSSQFGDLARILLVTSKTGNRIEYVDDNSAHLGFVSLVISETRNEPILQIESYHPENPTHPINYSVNLLTGEEYSN